MLAIERKTSNLLAIYGRLNPKFRVDRLYLLRKDREKSLTAIDYVELAVRVLGVYFPVSQERLTKAARGDKLDSLQEVSV